MRPRILFVESARGFGGSVVALGRLLRALPADAYERRVLVRFESQGEHLRRVAGPDLDVRLVPLAPGGPQRGRGLVGRLRGMVDHHRRHRPYARAVAREVRAFGADLVHANNSVTTNWGAIVGTIRAGVPCVVQQHGFEWRSRDVVRLASRVACFLPDSEHVARDLEGIGVPRERMVVTWCPIDPAPPCDDAGRAALRRELSLPDGAPVVAMAGMLLRWKGQHVFLDSLPEVLRRVPEARAVVVGGPAVDEDAGHEAELRAQAARLGVADRVVFTGFRGDVERLLPAFDVCVHASVRPEPFGMVVAEAMAAGRPVVASAAGGPTEQVEDGRSGYLVPPGDAAALADRVAALLLDPALARSFGTRGREIVAQRFATAHFAERVDGAYRRVLSAEAGPRVLSI